MLVPGDPNKKYTYLCEKSGMRSSWVRNNKINLRPEGSFIWRFLLSSIEWNCWSHKSVLLTIVRNRGEENGSAISTARDCRSHYRSCHGAEAASSQIRIQGFCTRFDTQRCYLSDVLVKYYIKCNTWQIIKCIIYTVKCIQQLSPSFIWLYTVICFGFLEGSDTWLYFMRNLHRRLEHAEMLHLQTDICNIYSCSYNRVGYGRKDKVKWKTICLTKLSVRD